MARNLIPGDTTIKAVKPGDARKRLNDGDGLYLKLFVKGGAHGWRFDYSYGGARNTLSLGTYPDTGLKAARDKADEYRKLLADGTDPSAVRKAGKDAQAAQRAVDRREEAGLPPEGSFEAIAREWLAKVHEIKVSTGHAERTRIRLEQDVFPWLGRDPIDEIEAPDLLTCLRRVEARGAIETAHRIKDSCGQVFRYGIATGACRRNPAADLADALQPVKTRHHAAIIDPKGVGALLRDIAAYEGHPVTRAALSLSALLLLRPGELRQCEWGWVELDEAMITIPSELMKRNQSDKLDGPPHLVPLAPQAVAILRELHPLTGGGRYVFPSLLTVERCMSENTVRAALRRLGYGNDDMTAHGFRATARTLIAERLAVDPNVIEAQLAHAVPDKLGRAYNRAQYLEQRIDMMKAWAAYIDQLRTGAVVLPFKSA